MGLTVVIITCKGGQLVERCVASLRPQRPERVLVVVSADALVDLPLDVDQHLLDRNVGFARAANAGLHAVPRGDVLLLNDDTRAEPGFIAALQAAATAHGPAIYQPRIVLADGSGRLDNTGHRLFPDGFNIARGRGAPRDQPMGPEAGAFSGAAVLLTRQVLDEVGGFDEDLEAFGEDLDLSLRARRQGFRVRYVPDAVIQHELGATYGRTNPRKVFLVERNRVLAGVRSLPAAAIATMPAWSALRLGALGVSAACGRGPGASAGLRGAAAGLVGGLAGLRGVPGALRKRAADSAHWTADDLDMWRHLARHRARASDLWGRA